MPLSQCVDDALTTAGVDAMVPASPTPFTRAGWRSPGLGPVVVNRGRSAADGT